MLNIKEMTKIKLKRKILTKLISMKNLTNKSKKIRLDLFKKFYLLQEGHPGSAFSILDFLVTIYYEKYVRLKSDKLKKSMTTL